MQFKISVSLLVPLFQDYPVTTDNILPPLRSFLQPTEQIFKIDGYKFIVSSTHDLKHTQNVREILLVETILKAENLNKLMEILEPLLEKLIAFIEINIGRQISIVHQGVIIDEIPDNLVKREVYKSYELINYTVPIKRNSSEQKAVIYSGKLDLSKLPENIPEKEMSILRRYVSAFYSDSMIDQYITLWSCLETILKYKKYKSNIKVPLKLKCQHTFEVCPICQKDVKKETYGVKVKHFLTSSFLNNIIDEEMANSMWDFRQVVHGDTIEEKEQKKFLKALSWLRRTTLYFVKEILKISEDDYPQVTSDQSNFIHHIGLPFDKETDDQFISVIVDLKKKLGMDN